MTTLTNCPHCGRQGAPHPIIRVRRTTERRHGTYIHAALGLHQGHTLTVSSGLQDLTLFCADCQRAVIEAGGYGRWRGEYESAECAIAGYEPQAQHERAGHR
jgi:hypothetical protein